MKTYRNKNGSPMTYDESKTNSVYDSKTGNIIVFSADETLSFIVENNIWDGYHHPFDVLNMKKWIQNLKIADNMCPLPINKIIPLRENNEKFRSDYDIAKDIRNYIDNSTMRM